MIQWNYCPVCASPLESSDVYPTCPNGDFTKYPNPAAGTNALIRFNNKYLFLQRNREPERGKWVIPGGFCNLQESGEETILREIKEETGLDARIEKYHGSFWTKYGTDGEFNLVLSYVCTVESDQVVLSEENSQYAWLAIEDAPDLAFRDCGEAVSLLKEQLSLGDILET